MPIYHYKCNNCGCELEILHSISELTEGLKEKTKEELFCVNCSFQDFTRIFKPTSLRFNTLMGSSDKTKLKADLKKRAHLHYKKEIEPQKRERIKKEKEKLKWK